MIYVGPANDMLIAQMWADTPEELEDVRLFVGKQPEHLIRHSKIADWQFYYVDIFERKDAIEFGAVQKDRHGAVEWLALRALNSWDERAEASARFRLKLIAQARAAQSE